MTALEWSPVLNIGQGSPEAQMYIPLNKVVHRVSLVLGIMPSPVLHAI